MFVHHCGISDYAALIEPQRLINDTIMAFCRFRRFAQSIHQIRSELEAPGIHLAKD